MVFEEFRRHTIESFWSSKGVMKAINLKRIKLYEGENRYVACICLSCV